VSKNANKSGNDERPYSQGLLGGLGSSINSLLSKFYKVTRSTVADYCPWAGIVNDYTLFQDNTNLVTLFEIKGATFLAGAVERTAMTTELLEIFTTILREENAAIQIVYQRDRRLVRDKLEKYYAPMMGKAKALRLDAERLLRERVDRMVPYLSGAEVFIAVYTNPGKMVSKQALKEFRAEQKANLDPDYPIEGYEGVQVFQEPDVVVHRHDATVRTLEIAFKKMRIEIVKLNVHDAIKVARRMIFPEETADSWRARLPGDAHVVKGYKITPGELPNVDAYTYSSIGRQIAAGSVDRGAGMDSVVQVGTRFVASQIMELSPTTAKPFDDLLEHVGDLNVPLRLSMTFYGGADKWLNSISLKKGLAYLATLTFPANARISAAGETMTEQVEQGGKTACGISISVSTWADDKKTAQERSKKLGRAIDSWGDIQSSPEVGDPFLAFTATVPGWSDNLRHSVVTTVDKMLISLPVSVISSPWKEGVLFFKNKQGGIFPYQPLSSEQQTSNVLAFAPPGGGKSVLISTLILAAILDPVLEGLPRIAAIDIGNSSKGVINLLREISPPELRDKFRHIEFELTDRFGINVMDTRLGCPYPTSAERGFLTNFLTLMFTPIGSRKPIDDAATIAMTLLDEVYRSCYEDNPQKYIAGQDPEVTSWLENQRDFEVNKRTTWWQVVYHAMDKHCYDIAGKAQRFAVPTIKMLSGILTMSDTLKSLYGDDNSSKLLLDARRMLLGFVGQYPSLCKASTFDFQETDVCIFDLNKVTQDTGDEGTRRTSIAYMVSRFLLGKDFLTNKDILMEMPPQAQEFYKSKVAQLEVVRKYLIYDEFHRTQGAEAVRRTVLDDMRNGRKFNLMVFLASQNFEDFDDDIIKQATVRFVLRVDSPEDAGELVKKYGWSETVRLALLRDVKGAGRDGAVMLMHATGLKNDDGQCTQVLTNVIGPTELAAYATTREDAALRDALTTSGIPYWDVVTLLGRFYPGGVQKIVEETMRSKRSTVNTASDDEDEKLRGALAPMIAQITEAYSASKGR
jgi:intracellular multiplication protein IcmB